MSPPRVAAWADLDPTTLYDLLRLRVDVFVVEQRCPYPELDGRDTDAGTEHVWCTDDRGVAAYLRVLAEPGGSRRVGRVVTRADVRGRGLADAMLRDVVRRHGDRVLVLDAQTYAGAVYARHGFRVAGEEFVEDGIPHVPMRRDPREQTPAWRPDAVGTPARQGGWMTDQTSSPEPVVDPDPADHPDVSGDPALGDDLDVRTDRADDVDDPDLQAAREAGEARQDPESLATDRLLPDVDDDTWEPGQSPSTPSAEGYTPSEEAGRETLDDRIRQEVPEPDPMAAGRQDADRDLRQT